MEATPIKDEKTYHVSLFVSLIYFCTVISFYMIFSMMSGGKIDLFFVFYWVLQTIPLILLYGLGFLYVKAHNKKKRENVGWVMNIYTFAYFLILGVYYVFLYSIGTGGNEGKAALNPYLLVFINYVIIGISFYIFLGLIFYLNKSKKQLIVAIISAMVVIGISFGVMEMTVVNVNQNTLSHLIGEITYMANESNPENASVGVWCKIALYQPHNASLEKFYIVVKSSSGEEIIELTFYGESVTKKYNYIAEFYDANKDGLVSTGDLVHIYGTNLSNSTILFGIHGYTGTIETHTKILKYPLIMFVNHGEFIKNSLKKESMSAEQDVILINWEYVISIPVYYTSNPQISYVNLAKEVYL